MIGIIVTGHGSFASGLTSGLKLLSGEPEYYEAVDFEPEDSIEELTKKLHRALNRLTDCESVVIFADLTGGSPFNAACRLKLTDKSSLIEVAGGSSLPVVLQAYLSRTMFSDAAALMDSSLEAGKNQMVRFQPEQPQQSGNECECGEWEE